jgi:hypothetical protein
LYTGDTNRIFKKFNPKNKESLKQSEFLRVASKILPNYKQNDLIAVFYDFDPPDAQKYQQIDFFKFEEKFNQAKQVYKEVKRRAQKA